MTQYSEAQYNALDAYATLACWESIGADEEERCLLEKFTRKCIEAASVKVSIVAEKKKIVERKLMFKIIELQERFKIEYNDELAKKKLADMNEKEQKLVSTARLFKKVKEYSARSFDPHFWPYYTWPMSGARVYMFLPDPTVLEDWVKWIDIRPNSYAKKFGVPRADALEYLTEVPQHIQRWRTSVLGDERHQYHILAVHKWREENIKFSTHVGKLNIPLWHVEMPVAKVWEFTPGFVLTPSSIGAKQWVEFDIERHGIPL